MGKPTGFLEYTRREDGRRPAAERVRDWEEFHLPLPEEIRRQQGARCMNCGVPFCQAGMIYEGKAFGCPLHNLIPEWNDMILSGNWGHALSRLLKANSFPEFTGRVCPAPCENACICGIYGDPITVRDNELSIIEAAFGAGKLRPRRPPQWSGKKVCVVGSGPAGLVAAWDLARRGARVCVVERHDRAGGLLMYGIPNMKLDKSVVKRRTDLMAELGIEFRLGVDAADADVAAGLVAEFDAVVVAAGACKARGVGAEGFDAGVAAGDVVYAVDYLTDQTRALLEGRKPAISAEGKDVVVIGGGDTGNDCMGTAVRQGARTVRQLEYGPRAPKERAASNLWPEWPNVAKTDYGQEEAIALQGDDLREWCADTQKVLLDDAGHVRGLQVRSFDWSAGKPESVEGSEREVDAQLVLVACGFAGPEGGVFDAFGVPLATQGRPLPVMAAGDSHRAMRAAAGKDDAAVYVAGDARTGSSLVVNAMADALKCAAEVASDLGL